MFRIKYSVIIMFTLILCLSVAFLVYRWETDCITCKAAVDIYENIETDTLKDETYENVYEIPEFDYGEIDKVMENADNVSFDKDFGELVDSIINSDSGMADNFFSELKNALFGVIIANKNAVLWIIVLAVFSALINSFLPQLDKGQVSLYANMVIEIIMITILSASFFSACNECVYVISTCIDIYKAVIPVFFSAVFVTTGNVTVAAYYEVVLMMMTVVNTFFKNVFVNLVKVQFLLVICDLVTGKEQFSKMCELLQSIVKVGCKTTIAIFAGIGGLKGIINPTNDVLKKNVLLKGLKLVPVVGGSVDAVSGTFFGAVSIIKNGIGLAAIIVLVTVCMIPVVKLCMITLLFKVTAAVIEPVASKNIVKAVNSTSIAIGLLTLINVMVVTLFILMTAIICVATNVGV